MTVITLQINPPEVDDDNVEEFLATDDLFVEYFNSFLKLPIFPDPLCFNKDTGGFELISHARTDLVDQIKVALRSQKRTPKIYKTAKSHSFKDIPLIPIEQENGVEPPVKEIDTMFAVTTLNKEQGIYWIKAQRLPTFLQSVCYHEYRLAKILTQVKIHGDKGEYVTMNIDFQPRPRKPRNKDRPQPAISPQDVLMKRMYVSMGDSIVSESTSWFSDAEFAHKTELTYSTTTRPTTSTSSMYRPTNSARPMSAFSSSTRYIDSGYGSSFVKCTSALSGSMSSLHEDDNDTADLISQYYSEAHAPQISDSSVCKLAENEARYHQKSVVYLDVQLAVDTTDGVPTTKPTAVLPDVDKDDKDDTQSVDSGTKLDDSESDEAEQTENKPLSIEELSADIARTVIKDSLAEIVNMTGDDDIRILNELLPDKQGMVTVDHLGNVTVTEKSPDDAPKPPETPSPLTESAAESDVDSLLDSEDDYEEQDTMFRTQRKAQKYHFHNVKGIEKLKEFIAGTPGQRHWDLWVDIDRSRVIFDADDQYDYLNMMRAKYLWPGAPEEMSYEMITSLGLHDSSVWTIRHLQTIQNKVAETLVRYWAPRFLLKQQVSTKPDPKLLSMSHNEGPRPISSVPHPTTSQYLPLRPKTCMPRLRRQLPAKPGVSVQESAENARVPETTPPIGMRRTYSQAALDFIKYKGVKQELPLINEKSQKMPALTPRQLVGSAKRVLPQTPLDSQSHIPSRPNSASSSRSGSAMSDVSEKQTIPSKRHHLPQSPKRPTSTLRRSMSTLSTAHSASGSTIRLSSTQLSVNTPRSQPEQARPGSEAGSVCSDRVTDLAGEGEKLELLLQALDHERDAGGFFRRYLERADNQLWIDNLSFWQSLENYHSLFLSSGFDPKTAENKAKMLYSMYLVAGSPHHIGCSTALSDDIYNRITPAYEELFDVAEEHTLSVLYSAWLDMLTFDVNMSEKVELIQVKRYLESKSKYVIHLQKKGLIRQRIPTPETSMEKYEDPVYDESILENIPEDFRDYTLEKLVHNRIELEYFREFLEDNYANMDLHCWVDIEAFRRMPHEEEKRRDAKARDIRVKYLNKKYFFGPNSPAGKPGQDKVMEAGGGYGKLLDPRPPNAVLLEAQKYVQQRLEMKWLPLFLTIPEFSERQKPRQRMDDVVDDIIVQKKKRSQQVMKLMESKWVSSSNEIITFRKALSNPVTSLHFQRFISIKGDNLENDILFWLEVQKYKDLNHNNTDDVTLSHKINAVINCFIDSQIPPSLQIDIPQEQADKILDRKHEKGPYLFRDAQLSVFRELFVHWQEFCEFRTNLSDDKVLSTIERHRRRAKAKEKAKQRAAEDEAKKKKVPTATLR